MSARLSFAGARRARLARLRDRQRLAQMPGVAPEVLSDALRLEAARPLRGGDADLPASSLFGDGHRQVDLVDWLKG